MKKYVFKPYSHTFLTLFQKEKERISNSLPCTSLIEHIGSTAVPDLGGKGIIDIGISVSKVNMEKVSSCLQKLGYEYRPAFSTSDRFYFVTYLKDPEEETRRYHIHLTYPDNPEWMRLIGFRDYLKNHPDVAKEYGEIKRQAALDADQNGEKYRKLKESIIQKIIGNL